MTELPDINAATFTDPAEVDNPYFPLPGGTINSYEATAIDPESGEEEVERNDHFATYETKVIDGIASVVVRDTAYADGFLVEDTLDWFAQDDAGNVWYMGEIAVNYNYDDDDNFIGTDFDGSWEAGVDGALAGYIMKAAPILGDSYFQEFYAGVAEDEGEVISVGEMVAGFDDVLAIFDTSELEPESGAIKYFAPGIGMVLEEEFDLTEPDVPELVIELTDILNADNSTPVDPTDSAFAGDGAEMTVTFLSEAANVNGAIGAYTFDDATGEIGEGRILFEDTEDVESGATATIPVPAGSSLGLFLIPDVEELGVELEDYLDGGLFFGNLTLGDVADVYDGDPSTTYTPGPATIHDGIAPVVMDADGNMLPIRAFHSVGNRDGFNFLNHVAGENAEENAASDLVDGVTVVGFEDALASTEDYDADFDDALVAVSAGPLAEEDLDALLDEIDISRQVGTDGRDRLIGTEDDDQLIGLDGRDLIFGGGGDDVIEAGDDNDRVRGGDGDDEISGEDGFDRLSGGDGDDEIEGGEDRDLLFGEAGNDTLFGDEGNDRLFGGAGFDELFGGEGDDRLFANADGARMSGGEGDDWMFGAIGVADTFVFDLIPFGDDRIRRFEDGLDLIEIASYLEVESFDDIEVEQVGHSTMLSFADGTVRLTGFDADLIDASDFVFA